MEMDFSPGAESVCVRAAEVSHDPNYGPNIQGTARGRCGNCARGNYCYFQLFKFSTDMCRNR